jgi:hypothetical protein
MSVETNSSQSSIGTGVEPTAETAQAADTPSDSIGLELVRLLAESQPTEGAADGAGGIAEVPVYDGHVALALDTDVLPDIDATLEMLTSAHQLFDVPALDVGNVIDDSLPS